MATAMMASRGGRPAPPVERFPGYRTQSAAELEATERRAREIGRLADAGVPNAAAVYDRVLSVPAVPPSVLVAELPPRERPIVQLPPVSAPPMPLPAPQRPPAPTPATTPVSSTPPLPPGVLRAGEGVTPQAVIDQRPAAAPTARATAGPAGGRPSGASLTTAPPPEEARVPWLWIALVAGVLLLMSLKG